MPENTQNEQKQSSKPAGEQQYKFIFSATRAKQRMQTWILAGIVVITFGLSGPLVRAIYDAISGKESSADVVMEMAGMRITRTEIEAAQRATDVGLKLKFTENIPEEVSKIRRKLDLQKAASLHTAKNLGFSTGNAELQEQLKREFTDQKGVFNENELQNFLSYRLPNLGIHPKQFMDFLSDTITIQKVGDAIGCAALVPPFESSRMLAKLTDNFTVELATVGLADVGGKVDVSEKDAKEYYEQHTSIFEAPERIKVKYISFKADDFADKTAQVRKELALDYYANNKSNFRTIGEDGKPVTKPFAEVRDAVYAAVEKTRVQEYYELHSDEFTESGTNDTPAILPLEKVQGVISNILAQNDALAAAEKDATEFVKLLMPAKGADGIPFEKAAAQCNLQVSTSAYFSVMDEFDGSFPMAFYREAFSLAADEIPGSYSMPVSSSNAAYVIAFDHKTPQRIPEFDEISDRVYALAKTNKISTLQTKNAEEIRDEIRDMLKNGKKFAEAAKARKLETQTSGPFSWYNPPTNINVSAQLMRNIVDRYKGELTEPIRSTNGYTIAYISDRTAGEMSLQPELQFRVSESAMQELAYLLFNEWQTSVTHTRLQQEESGEVQESLPSQSRNDLPFDDW